MTPENLSLSHFLRQHHVTISKQFWSSNILNLNISWSTNNHKVCTLPWRKKNVNDTSWTHRQDGTIRKHQRENLQHQRKNERKLIYTNISPKQFWYQTLHKQRSETDLLSLILCIWHNTGKLGADLKICFIQLHLIQIYQTKWSE